MLLLDSVRMSIIWPQVILLEVVVVYCAFADDNKYFVTQKLFPFRSMFGQHVPQAFPNIGLSIWFSFAIPSGGFLCCIGSIFLLSRWLCYFNYSVIWSFIWDIMNCSQIISLVIFLDEFLEFSRRYLNVSHMRNKIYCFMMW